MTAVILDAFLIYEGGGEWFDYLLIAVSVSLPRLPSLLPSSKLYTTGPLITASSKGNLHSAYTGLILHLHTDQIPDTSPADEELLFTLYVNIRTHRFHQPRQIRWTAGTGKSFLPLYLYMTKRLYFFRV